MKPYHDSQGIELYHGDCLQVLKELPAESVHCVVTSPPYWGLRDYGTDGQLGLEETPEQHVSKMVEVFSEVRRVLRTDGTLWLNYGDSYSGGKTGRADTSGDDAERRAKQYGSGTGPGNGPREYKQRATAPGLKPKDLCGIPWRVAFALQADGWYLRQDIIWHKPNPMPESVTDRCTKAHEYIFLLTKAARYHYDADAIKEAAERAGSIHGGGNKTDAGRNDIDRNTRPVCTNPVANTRNRRSVWTISTAAYPGAHFATFPPKLIEPCIMAGCPEGGTVLDPFLGSGTTGAVAQKNGCKFIGIELNEEYLQLAVKRFTQKVLF
tara:strand:+ start:128 stop:1096 length:969 start_codon:yes stop_codon:yes gene_type:complete